MIQAAMKLFISFITMWFVAMTVVQAAEPSNPAGGAEFKSCYAKWTEHELVIGNRKCERKWRIDKGLLTATSFRNLSTGTEWIRQPAKQPAPVTTAWRKNVRSLVISASSGKLGVTGEESLQVMVVGGDDKQTLCRFRIFPEASGVEILTGDPGEPQPANTTTVEKNQPQDRAAWRWRSLSLLNRQASPLRT